MSFTVMQGGGRKGWRKAVAGEFPGLMEENGGSCYLPAFYSSVK